MPLKVLVSIVMLNTAVFSVASTTYEEFAPNTTPVKSTKSNPIIDSLNLLKLTQERQNYISKILGAPKEMLLFYGLKRDEKLGYDKIYLQVKNNKLIDIIYVDDRGNYIVGDIITKDGLAISHQERIWINKTSSPSLNNGEKKYTSERLIRGFKEGMLDKYSKYRFTFKGHNPSGKDLLIFSEPVCPACQNLERSGILSKLIKHNKSVTIFVRPLSMHKRKNVYLRSRYLLQKIENPMLSEQGKIDLMSEAGKASLSTIALETDNEDEGDFWSDFYKFDRMGIINGTPILTTIDGEDMREILEPILEIERKLKRIDSTTTQDTNITTTL